MITQGQLDDAIKQFAQGVAGHHIGLVLYKPETWASAMHCFANVLRKIELEGGNGIGGRYFLHRTCAFDTSLDYVMAVHHMVWQRSNCELVDITPHHYDPKHRPYQPTRDHVLFMVDPAAKPVVRGALVAPLPIRFIPIGENPRLTHYLMELTRQEQDTCERIYNGELPPGTQATIRD